MKSKRTFGPSARTSAAALALAGLPLAAAAAYSYTTVDQPGMANTQLWDINNNGAIIGTSFNDTTSQSFILSGGVYTAISGPAGALGTNAMGVSDAGVVVGNYYDTMVTEPDGSIVTGPNTGFILAGGAYTPITFGSGSDVYARAISPDGRYVSGYYFDTQYHGFVLDRSTSAVTVFASSTVLIIPQGINSSGLLVGSQNLTTGPRVSYTYDIATGVRNDYSFAGATGTSFRAINDSGTIAGWFNDASGTTHGFVGTTSAHQVLDVPGATTTYVEGIDNAGELVGNYIDAAGVAHGFIATSVPEPSGALLLACGGVLLVVRLRRR